MKQSWWKESIVYQIYPRSFCDSNGDGVGDLRGIIGKLDYLQALGIDVVWLSPVYKSPNDDNGYDISDYRAIMDDFGALADWEELLADFAQQGLDVTRTEFSLTTGLAKDGRPCWIAQTRRAIFTASFSLQ